MNPWKYNPETSMSSGVMIKHRQRSESKPPKLTRSKVIIGISGQKIKNNPPFLLKAPILFKPQNLI
ncbi:MAG: hypothetical protein EBT92_17295 [Planctomycetes bacterium]|nr:hypothetical protein [Planctomycetota bacterium]